MRKPLTRSEILDLYYVEARHKMIDLGAFLDRVARATGEDDFRMAAFHCALAELCSREPQAAKRILLAFSDPTDDYISMVASGCAAVCEPAFWAGFDRGSADSFHDYFLQLTDYEPKRAAKFGLPHFCWLCINPKESEDVGLAKEVLALIPEFIDHVEEHTVEMVLDAGFWAGMTLYPGSKCSPVRAIDIVETYGAERLWMNSACDWGVSIPLSIPYTAMEMRRRGHSADAVDALIYQNPLEFLSQCPKFML